MFYIDIGKIHRIPFFLWAKSDLCCMNGHINMFIILVIQHISEGIGNQFSIIKERGHKQVHGTEHQNKTIL